MSTIQLDFAAKERFELSYQDKDGKENKEVFVIHRAPLSSHERFIAFLIEHYAGHFPLWLSPVQVKIVTVNDSNTKFAKIIEEELKSNNIRVELDERQESIGKKVRDAQLMKIPIVITIGDKEVEAKTLAVREQGKVKFGIKLDSFIHDTIKKVKERC